MSAVLSRLKGRELVRHKPPYWSVANGQRIAAATGLSRSLDALDGQLGPEDIEEWRDGGADGARSNDDERDVE